MNQSEAPAIVDHTVNERVVDLLKVRAHSDKVHSRSSSDIYWPSSVIVAARQELRLSISAQ